MMIQQFYQVLAAARPGSKITVWHVEVPTEPNGFTQSDSAVAVLDPPAEQEAWEPKTNNSALDRALAYKAHDPQARLTAREWADVVDGVSERELDRATGAGALAFEPRGEGKGHRARVIRVEEMVRYLGLCEAVQAGRASKPSWWHDVRKGVSADVA